MRKGVLMEKRRWSCDPPPRHQLLSDEVKCALLYHNIYYIVTTHPSQTPAICGHVTFSPGTTLFIPVNDEWLIFMSSTTNQSALYCKWESNANTLTRRMAKNANTDPDSMCNQFWKSELLLISQNITGARSGRSCC